MRVRSPILLAPLFVLLAAASPFWGPPHIRVTEVTGKAPVPGAVIALITEHHTDAEDADVTAEATTVRNGQRSTKPITVTKAAAKGHYGVTKQWDAGSPWVLVFTIKQGPDGSHGTASAVVKVDATGKVAGIEELTDKNTRGDRYPRGASKADVDRALRELGAQ